MAKGSNLLITQYDKKQYIEDIFKEMDLTRGKSRHQSPNILPNNLAQLITQKALRNFARAFFRALSIKAGLKNPSQIVYKFKSPVIDCIQHQPVSIKDYIKDFFNYSEITRTITNFRSYKTQALNLKSIDPAEIDAAIKSLGKKAVGQIN